MSQKEQPVRDTIYAHQREATGNEQWFSSTASLLKMVTSLKGKNLLSELFPLREESYSNISSCGDLT